jgi:DNA-binding MarR family transcriptional regulator
MPEPPEFDPVLLSPARLGVVAALLARGSAPFPELKGLLGLTQGNLGAHLRVLEEAGYVEVEKGYDGRRPRTTCRLTAAGRRALERHVARLEAILRRAGRG